MKEVDVLIASACADLERRRELLNELHWSVHDDHAVFAGDLGGKRRCIIAPATGPAGMSELLDIALKMDRGEA